MKTDIYIKFKPYEDRFRSAVHSGFIRFTRPEMDAFSKIVEEHRGYGITANERTCPHCTLTLIKKIANEYFTFKNSPRGKKVDKEAENEIEDGGVDSI